MNTHSFFNWIRRSTIMLSVLVWSSQAFCGEIHDAAKNGDLEKIKALLKDNPDLVSSKDTNNIGATPLYVAATFGHKDVMELLLANKADVNAGADHGVTPLHLAAMMNHLDVAELLVASNANVNAKADNGVTPLHMAAAAGSKGIVELLLTNKADINAKDNRGWTPLHMAAGRGYNPESEKRYKDMADLLRQHGGHE